MSNVEYHLLRPRELVARREKLPIAYMGLGILEWHGLHNPLGLDGVKANAIACHMARKFGGVVMPPQFWGENRKPICELAIDPAINSWIPKEYGDQTIQICEYMLLEKAAFLKDAQRSVDNGEWKLWIDLMVHTLFEIETLGFKAIVLIPGHYPLFPPLDTAINNYKKAGGKSSVFKLTDYMFADDGNSGDHAAKFETSLMMALCPELVDLSQLDPDIKKHNIGVVGDDPRTEASEEFGFTILKKFEQLIEKYLQETFGSQ